MRLPEDHGKRLFREYGLTVPRGRTVTTSDAGGISGPVVLRALVPVGGRGKAGDVLKASSSEEARAAAERLLGMEIKGFRAGSVLIEEEIAMPRELYLSPTVDLASGLPVLLASAKGGVDIESLPDSENRTVDGAPLPGRAAPPVRDVARALGVQGHRERLGRVPGSARSLFRGMDCELVGINPLVFSDDGFTAADAKVIINDDVLFRHPEIGTREQGPEGLEAEARSRGTSFVRLDGDIGVIGQRHRADDGNTGRDRAPRGSGGAFLDLGGTDDPAKVEEAFGLMARAKPKVVLLNIFGGITKCDTVAEGVLSAMDKLGHPFPVVARIRGVNEDIAREMLRGKGIASHLGLEGAVKEAVALEGTG